MSGQRRIDQILSPDFIHGLEGIDIEELRSRRRLAREVENELSYYRRMLHGRLDLLRFEIKRRRGDEQRSLIEALPEILSGEVWTSSSHGRAFATDLPPMPEIAKREIDRVLGDDLLTRLDTIDEESLESAIDAIETVEAEISAERRQVQAVEDVVVEAFSRRLAAESAKQVDA
ncbi:MAG: hypothetical protein OEM66_01835 [Acidimicrobiia bacterium]|nr:hypothetical protein [Acidimicrobiia bacterium]